MKTADDRDFIKRQYTDDYGGNPYSKSRGAGVVLITANREAEIDCDVVLYTATSRNLDQGIAISPQFPILVLTDIFMDTILKTILK